MQKLIILLTLLCLVQMHPAWSAARDSASANNDRVKAKVMIFFSPDCPIAQSYMPALKEMKATCDRTHISFEGIVSAADYSDKEVAAFRKDYQPSFQIVMDEGNLLATRYGATISPEAIVMAPSGEMIYRGRIDGRYFSRGKQRSSNHYSTELKDVIESISSGQVPHFSETTAVGCNLNGTAR